MPKAAELILEPRKRPQQSRSAATVDAIHDATIQVLLAHGPDRLTTVHVAQRAGVSVGTLYQYYPNKQALLFAILERHLMLVAAAVENACATSHYQPLEQMIHALVNAFVDAKLRERETSVALYSISSAVGGNLIADRMRKRSQAAMIAMFRTAAMPPSTDVNFLCYMLLSAMAGTVRGVLENGAPPPMIRKLREHLFRLALAYCKAA